MKTLFTKKTIMITLAATIIFGAFLIFFFLQKDTYPSTNSQIYPQTAIATIFAPSKHPPVVTLKSAQANSNTLTFTLAISGLELVKNTDDFENIICDPYLQTDPPVQWVTKGYENQIPKKAGDPIIITYNYEYSIDAKKHQNLSVEMTLTIYWSMRSQWLPRIQRNSLSKSRFNSKLQVSIYRANKVSKLSKILEFIYFYYPANENGILKKDAIFTSSIPILHFAHPAHVSLVVAAGWSLPLKAQLEYKNFV